MLCMSSCTQRALSYVQCSCRFYTIWEVPIILISLYIRPSNLSVSNPILKEEEAGTIMIKSHDDHDYEQGPLNYFSAQTIKNVH